MGTTGRLIAEPASLILGLGNQLCADIPADKFAVRQVQNINHAAFIMGHITIHVEMVLRLIGREDLLPEEDWGHLFAKGAECTDDPEKYPDKQTIMQRFNDSFNATQKALADLDDDILLAENPTEIFNDFCATLAGAISLLLRDHSMYHLGQISSLRRTMGLGPVM